MGALVGVPDVGGLDGSDDIDGFDVGTDEIDGVVDGVDDGDDVGLYVDCNFDFGLQRCVLSLLCRQQVYLANLIRGAKFIRSKAYLRASFMTTYSDVMRWIASCVTFPDDTQMTGTDYTEYNNHRCHTCL
eukprot:scaffold7928_cov119-Skeletonema_dohrnii-CCMP3373.AAC.4